MSTSLPIILFFTAIAILAIWLPVLIYRRMHSHLGVGDPPLTLPILLDKDLIKEWMSQQVPPITMHFFELLNDTLADSDTPRFVTILEHLGRISGEDADQGIKEIMQRVHPLAIAKQLCAKPDLLGAIKRGASSDVLRGMLEQARQEGIDIPKELQGLLGSSGRASMQMPRVTSLGAPQNKGRQANQR